MARTFISNILSTIGIIGLLAGCAPGLGEGVVPRVSEETSQRPIAPTLSSLRFILVPVTDARDSMMMVKVNERQVPSTIAIPGFVHGTVTDVFKKAGASIVAFDAPYVAISISQWISTVNPHFPSSSVDGTVVFNVEIQDRDHKPTWRGKYNAEYSSLHPFLTSTAIESNLGDTLVVALQECAADEKFIAALRAVQS